MPLVDKDVIAATRPAFSWDEFCSLTKPEREMLASLARAPYLYAQRRQWPSALAALVAKGLAFRSHRSFTITDLGLEVNERVS